MNTLTSTYVGEEEETVIIIISRGLFPVIKNVVSPFHSVSMIMNVSMQWLM